RLLREHRGAELHRATESHRRIAGPPAAGSGEAFTRSAGPDHGRAAVDLLTFRTKRGDSIVAGCCLLRPPAPALRSLDRFREKDFLSQASSCPRYDLPDRSAFSS